MDALIKEEETLKVSTTIEENTNKEARRRWEQEATLCLSDDGKKKANERAREKWEILDNNTKDNFKAQLEVIILKEKILFMKEKSLPSLENELKKLEERLLEYESEALFIKETTSDTRKSLIPWEDSFTHKTKRRFSIKK